MEEVVAERKEQPDHSDHSNQSEEGDDSVSENPTDSTEISTSDGDELERLVATSHTTTAGDGDELEKEEVEEAIPAYSDAVVQDNSDAGLEQVEEAVLVFLSGTQRRQREIRAEVAQLMEEVRVRKQTYEEIREEYKAMLDTHSEQQWEQMGKEMSGLTEYLHGVHESVVKERITGALEQFRSELGDEVETRYQRRRAELEEGAALQLQAKIQELENIAEREREERVEVINGLYAKIDGLQALFEIQAKYEHLSAQLHQLSKTSSTLAARVRASEPFQPEANFLQTMASNDEFLSSVLTTIPASVVKEGVPSVVHLQRSFQRLETGCFQAYYLPPSPTLWDYVVAQVFTRITLSDHNMRLGSDDSAKLARAGYHIDQGDVSKCVDELHSLSSPLKAVCESWLADAEDRLVTQQALSLIEDHIASLQLAYSEQRKLPSA